MTRDDDVALIRRALDAAEPKLPKKPEVKRYELELYVDSEGDEAALITVVLKDPTPERLYDWTELAPIRDAIVAACREAGVSRWPYVEFRLQSELEGPADDDNEAAEP